MNGNIFIGWCGSNRLAIEVSKVLTKNQFKCIIGGKYEDPTNVYIGGTILEQLKSCNQALFIVQKNDSGSISNNVIFEIGFQLSKFDNQVKHLHLFYLDIDPKDKSIPSDLLGAWANHINTNGLDVSEIVSIITESFLKEQKLQLVQNKMELINNWHYLNNIVMSHFDSPTCSDFEMAQYLLFYSVSSGFINIFPQMKECITLLKKNVDEKSEELYHASKLATIIHEFGMSIKKKDNICYLDDSAYVDASDSLKKELEWADSYSADNFKKDSDFIIWFEMIARQRQGYVSMMYVNNPELSTDEIDEGYREAILYSEQTVVLCDRLREMDSKNNRELSTLYRSFAERNLSIAYGYFEEQDKERYYKYQSFEDKRFLREYSKDLVLDIRIADSFERGYFLAMAEILKYETDARKIRIYKKEIEAYTNYMLTIRDTSNQYVNRIKLMLESNETKGV